MKDHGKTIIVDSNTVASHPGDLEISPIRWLAYRPFWPMIWASLLILSIFFALKEQFLVGCSNPAKVVSLNPMMVAAYTNLRCSFDAPHCYSIKIIKGKLPKKQSGTYQVGDRVLTVSLYSGALDKDRWLTFDPIPAILVSGDEAALDNIKNGLGEEWERLDHWLGKVPQPYEPGLYAFDQGNDIPRGATQEAPDGA